MLVMLGSPRLDRKDSNSARGCHLHGTLLHPDLMDYISSDFDHSGPHPISTDMALLSCSYGSLVPQPCGSHLLDRQGKSLRYHWFFHDHGALQKQAC
jgi:hypothetical protein